MTLTVAQKTLIARETRRINAASWKLYPFERKGRRSGYVRLTGVLPGGGEVLIARFYAETPAQGDALYLATCNYLASRDDWQGISDSWAVRSDKSENDEQPLALTDEQLARLEAA